MKFNKITKKDFVDKMTSCAIIFASGGFTKRRLSDASFESQVIELCEEIDVDNSEQFRCVAKSNHIERIMPNGDVSRCDLQSGATYYEYGNILVVENIYDDKANYVIYIAV
jgi:hypothetical protein